MSEVVFDIETIGDIRNHDDLKITVVSIYDYDTDKYISFEEHELGDLWKFFEKAERLIGYNILHFDIPVLNKYYAGDLLSFANLDLLNIIKKSCGTRFKLNDIARATLQIEKSADGLRAQKWFEEGRIDEVKKYCEQDVRVTKGIYEYGRKNKMLYYPTLTGEIVPIAVDFDPPAKAAQGFETGSSVNLTLPI